MWGCEEGWATWTVRFLSCVRIRDGIFFLQGKPIIFSDILLGIGACALLSASLHTHHDSQVSSACHLIIQASLAYFYSVRGIISSSYPFSNHSPKIIQKSRSSSNSSHSMGTCLPHNHLHTHRAARKFTRCFEVAQVELNGWLTPRYPHSWRPLCCQETNWRRQ